MHEPPPLNARQIAVLRRLLLYPQGLRQSAYPGTMPLLQALGFAVSRDAVGPGRKKLAWFITREGADHLAQVDGSRPRLRRGASD